MDSGFGIFGRQAQPRRSCKTTMSGDFMIALDKLALGAINGMSFAMILFLLAVGLQLIFGLMNIVNLAHGSFYVIGGLVGFSVGTLTGNFVLGLLVGGGAIALFSLMVERLISRYTTEILGQALLTWGFVYVLQDLHRKVWGSYPLGMAPPEVFSGALSMLGRGFPVYRVALIFIGLAIAYGLWRLQEKTRLGAMIRAGVDDREMASALGINIKLLATGVFTLGAFFCGLGGGLALPIIPIEPGLEWRLLVLALVVLVVGGPGTVLGALIGSLVIGMVDSFSKILLPVVLANFCIYVVMAIVLIIRPSGLIARYRRAV